MCSKVHAQNLNCCSLGIEDLIRFCSPKYISDQYVIVCCVRFTLLVNYRYQRTAVDDLNDEFRRKITGQEPIKPRQRASQVAYISQESSNDEIVYWLQAKGFSSK